MAVERHHFELFADYFQFYIQDEPVEGNLYDSWDQAAVDRLLALTEGTIGVGTVRNMTVPVEIEIHESIPGTAFDEWDQVNECSIDVKSGCLVVAGCTDYFPEAARIKVAPGTYRARVLYGNLDALSEDGLEGEDRYVVQLWPAAPAALTVLKARPR